MLIGKDDLSLFVNRVNSIMMVKENFVQVFFWRHSNKEYRQHHPTYYFNDLLSQLIIVVKTISV